MPYVSVCRLSSTEHIVLFVALVFPACNALPRVQKAAGTVVGHDACPFACISLEDYLNIPLLQTPIERSTNARYDALGDSPGAQGVSSQGPRSPSVYSHFSQSVFSQSAYGPSAYGPSQRRLQAGSQYGHSQYDNASSASGSQYPGPVPSHFGASQMSESTSYHASGGGGGGGGAYGHGQGHGHASFGGGGNNFGVHGAPWGGRAAGSGGLGSGGIALRVPPPSYNPNAPRGSGGIDAGPGGVGMVGGRGGGGGGGGGGAAATAAAAASAAATAAAVMRDGGAGGGYNRGRCGCACG